MVTWSPSFKESLAPAIPRQRVGRAALALPGLHAALVVLHIEVHPDVRIGPFDLRHGARQRHGLVRVEFGGEGVVRGYRPSEHDRQPDTNHDAHGFHRLQKLTISPTRAIRGARIPNTWFAFAAF